MGLRVRPPSAFCWTSPLTGRSLALPLVTTVSDLRLKCDVYVRIDCRCCTGDKLGEAVFLATHMMPLMIKASITRDATCIQ